MYANHLRLYPAQKEVVRNDEGDYVEKMVLPADKELNVILMSVLQHLFNRCGAEATPDVIIDEAKLTILQLHPVGCACLFWDDPEIREIYGVDAAEVFLKRPDLKAAAEKTGRPVADIMSYVNG
jgi:hypothetical protein